MKRMVILGLFMGALLVVGYEPAAQALPAFAPGFAKSDSVVEKAYYGRGVARRTTRRTARRVYRRHY